MHRALQVAKPIHLYPTSTGHPETTIDLILFRFLFLAWHSASSLKVSWPIPSSGRLPCFFRSIFLWTCLVISFADPALGSSAGLAFLSFRTSHPSPFLSPNNPT